MEETVTSLAPGGDGVLHAMLGGERRAVFVARSAPGDRLRIAVDASRRPARGTIVDVIMPGPDRVPPPCPWSTRCGGCDWMHLALEGQSRAHAEHVRDALPATMREVAIDVHPAHAGSGSRALGYRGRARVHAQASSSGRVQVGMHEAGTHDPVEVETCVVLDPALDRVRGSLPDILHGSRGRGDVQLGLGANRLPVFHVRWSGTLAPRVFAALEAAVAQGTLAGAQLSTEGATRPATIGDPTPWTTGADGAPLRLAPASFGQASESANADLVHHVIAEVKRRRGANPVAAVELYAGAGNLSVMLARETQSLISLESDAEACEAARANLAARGLAARVIEGDAESFTWPSATRLVVLDPPRAGARRVAERLAAGRVPTVVYVSCDPPTLGRDLGILADAYRLTSLATLEMFPHTSHVEAVAVLERRPR